jgi:hypothetical protein
MYVQKVEAKKIGKILRSGSVCQRYGSADPDPHQNVTNPEHWCPFYSYICTSNVGLTLRS